MRVRSYTNEDIPGWVRLRKELWPDCTADIHDTEIRLVTENPDSATVMVLVDDDSVVRGFAELSVRERVDGALSDQVGYLEGWYVVPHLRGNGWGRELIAASEAWLMSKGLTEVASDAEIGNTQGIEAHRALGFRETFRVVQFIKQIGR